MNAWPYIEVFKSDGFQSVTQDKHVKESDNLGTGESRYHNMHFWDFSWVKTMASLTLFLFPLKRSFKYLQQKLSFGSYVYILHLSLIGRRRHKTGLSTDCETVKDWKWARIMSELSKSAEKAVKVVPKLQFPCKFYVAIFTGPVQRARGRTVKHGYHLQMRHVTRP